MVLAQISDLHVRRRGVVLPHIPLVIEPLRRVLSALDGLRTKPDAIIATGDLVESGAAEEYQLLRSVLDDSSIPVYLLAGNHDRRDALRRVFYDHAYLQGETEYVQYAIEGEKSRLVAVDSSAPPQRTGYLDAARIEALDVLLRRRPDTPTILAMHHPPMKTPVERLSRTGFTGLQDFAALLRHHPQVVRIICGHLHQALHRQWHGTTVVAAPSTAPTFVLHARGGFRWESGGFFLHRYSPISGFSSELVRANTRPQAAIA